MLSSSDTETAMAGAGHEVALSKPRTDSTTASTLGSASPSLGSVLSPCVVSGPTAKPGSSMPNSPTPVSPTPSLTSAADPPSPPTTLGSESPADGAPAVVPLQSEPAQPPHRYGTRLQHGIT